MSRANTSEPSDDVAQANARLMAAAIEALNAQDSDMADALFDDVVEWRPALSPGGAVGGNVYGGKSGMVAYLKEVTTGLDNMRVDVEQIDPVGGDRVFYRARLIAQRSATGIPVNIPVWGLWQVRNGKLFRGAAFLTEDEALEAAGLEE